MNTRIAPLLGLCIAASLACAGILGPEEPRFDNALALGVSLPPVGDATVDVPLSRFLVPHTGLDAAGRPLDDLDAEALAACAAGEDLHARQLGYAAVEIAADALRVSGQSVVALDGGRLPADQVQVVEPVLEALHERMVAAKRWEARGCVPWGDSERVLLVAADPAVPAATVQAVLRTGTLAGFSRHALAAEGIAGRSAPLPALPGASARRLSVLVGSGGIDVTGVDLETHAAPGDFDWPGLGATLDEVSATGEVEILVAVEPGLPYGVLARAVDVAAVRFPTVGIAVARAADLPAASAGAPTPRQLAPEDTVAVLWATPPRYDVVPAPEGAPPRASGSLRELLATLDAGEEEPYLEVVEIDAVVKVADDPEEIGDAEGPGAADLFGDDEQALDIAAPEEEAPEAEPEPTPRGAVILESPRVYGTLDASQVGEVVRRSQPDLLACYGQGLARRPRLAGAVKVHYVIGSGGGVKSADIAFTTLRNQAVETCLVGAFGALDFPDPGADVEVFHKLVFSP